MTYTSDEAANGVRTFLRNRYFYGKLMDVYQFESEQNYFNQKRWLLNRLVTGHGVLCGLNVKLSGDGKSLQVTPGMALDKMGREIVVPSLSKAVTIPTYDPGAAPPPDPCDDGACGSLYICFHECSGEPVPVFTGECDSSPSCSAGVIRERYELTIREGKAPKIGVDCTLQDLVSGGQINYEALVNYVSKKDCLCPGGDGCIPLANIKLPKTGAGAAAGDIDISVRPIVYTNDLLFDLLLCLTSNVPSRPAGGKY